MVGTEGPAVDGAIAAKCRGEIWRSTEGGSVVAGAATAVDMVDEQARSVYTSALLEVVVLEGKLSLQTSRVGAGKTRCSCSSRSSSRWPLGRSPSC